MFYFGWIRDLFISDGILPLRPNQAGNPPEVLFYNVTDIFAATCLPDLDSRSFFDN